MVHAYNKGFNRTPESSGPVKPREFGGGSYHQIWCMS